MKKVFFSLVIMMFGFSVFAQNTDKLVGDYFNLKNALVKGDDKAASEAASALQKSIKDSKAFSQKENLQKAVDKLAGEKDLKEQRAALADVSTTLWDVVKNSEKVSQPVYYQYCPMKKAYWLSNEKKIENPYYGSSMLSCGRVVETKE